ncbi:MAG: tetratricopeptide repeat protein [Planctomycetaceae bacterium]|nr:tetratricopeptide repeat protein [Planctomycetaceae bacterium]
MVIEIDDDFVEARANLGCVLMELGHYELAEAAFHGALAYHGEYPDAHYHLARLLDEVGRSHEAIPHWRSFLQLAPTSPWAEEAADRIAQPED